MTRIVSLLALVFSACNTSEPPPNAPLTPTSACKAPKTQTISQPCCTDWGADACGAGLFCAAFDGRQETTCYAERSREDLADCSEDVQCMSGACNGEFLQCKSLPGSGCELAVGCAKVGGTVYICDANKADMSCQPVGLGRLGDVCIDDNDCVDGDCLHDHCWLPLGHQCSGGAQCGEGTCHATDGCAGNDCDRRCLEYCDGHWSSDCPKTDE